MPDLRPRSDLRSSSRYNRNNFLFGSDVYSNLEDGQIPAPIRTNVAAPARRGRRGRGRGRAAAGATRPPPPPTDAQQQETSAENGDAQDTEGRVTRCPVCPDFCPACPAETSIAGHSSRTSRTKIRTHVKHAYVILRHIVVIIIVHASLFECINP